ncbi:MAG TPA: DUF1840 domain-containing protein [Candidatus Binatia bacterium]|nr:DUF1840 domain-containing protein [Candidatus Binatia bacterium]
MIRFTSPSGGEVSMLDAHARSVIEGMGHAPSARGAVATADVPEALRRLRESVGASRAASAPAGGDADHEEEERQQVDFARRAFPLIALLERAAEGKQPVLWGV